MAIGIFDSGVGGLTVLKEVRKVLPNEKIYYLGDTARVPYGDKTKELIVRYSKQIVEFLLEKKVDAIVVACNTATSLALEELQETFKIPIIGVIDAGVKTALYTTKENKIGVIGTAATIGSKKYEIEIKNINSNIEVYSKACPLFVHAVEEGILNGKLVKTMIGMYLDEIVNNIDTLILGCTHYPLLKEAINEVYPNLKIVDPAKETAQDLKKILLENKKIENNKIKSKVEYFVTDGSEKFKEIGTMFLGEKIEFAELIKL